MVSYQLTSGILESAQVAIPSGYAAGVYSVGKLDVLGAKVAVIARRVIEDSVAIPVLSNCQPHNPWLLEER